MTQATGLSVFFSGGFGTRVEGLGIRDSGLGIRDSGLGIPRVLCFRVTLRLLQCYYGVLAGLYKVLGFSGFRV